MEPQPVLPLFGYTLEETGIANLPLLALPSMTACADLLIVQINNLQVIFLTQIQKISICTLPYHWHMLPILYCPIWFNRVYR